MTSGAENPIYHRSKLIKSYDIIGDEYGPYNDYFGSNYANLFRASIKNSTSYTVKQRDRLDQISFIYYGTTSLWWAISLYNDAIIHPLLITPGQSISIPSKTEIDAFLVSYKSSRVNNLNTTVQV